MNTYNAEQTKDLSFFNKNVYLDKKFLLLIQETPLTAELKAILKEWDFSLLYSDGEPSGFMSLKTDTSSESKDVLDSNKENEIISEKQKRQKEVMEEVENKFWDFLKFTDKILRREFRKAKFYLRSWAVYERGYAKFRKIKFRRVKFYRHDL